ncbi:MAG: hypothetical protein LBQ02_04820 [Candidatus Nomurabacteria bacterium]|nr:hypothetical protein [Candidatus Nomurabacteria bacterium]
MLKALFKNMPARATKHSELVFARPAALDFQSEGEYRQLTGVRRLTITKSERYLTVIKP